MTVAPWFLSHPVPKIPKDLKYPFSFPSHSPLYLKPVLCVVQVDSLKTVCEHGLKAHIDHDSVLYFLSMADQFNAKHLRVSVLMKAIYFRRLSGFFCY